MLRFWLISAPRGKLPSRFPPQGRLHWAQGLAEGVTVKQGPSLTQSGDIIALTEDIQQAEQLLDQAMGVLP